MQFSGTKTQAGHKGFLTLYQTLAPKFDYWQGNHSTRSG